MLETILTTTNTSTSKTLTKLEDDTDFSLDKHYKERIDFHTKMLFYYLNEEQNEKLAIRNRSIPGNITRN